MTVTEILSNNNNAGYIAYQLCHAASKGDVAELKRLIAAGADVNACDYNRRTPLHLAVAGGHSEAVEFLIASGANIHAQDKYGATPIHESNVNKQESVALLLKSKGADQVKNVETLAALPDFTTALNQALSLMCSKYNMVYGAAFVVDKNNNISLSDAWFAPNKYVNKLSEYRKLSESRSRDSVAAGHGLAGRVLASKKAEWIEDVAHNNYSDFHDPEVAKAVGFHCGVGIPVIYEDRVIAALILRALEPRKLDEAQLAYFMDIATNQIAASVAAINTPFVSGVFQEQMNLVYNIIVNQGVFSSAVIHREVDWFYNHLGLNSFYFENTPPNTIAKHLHSFIAAKKLAQTTGTTEDLSLKDEHETWAMYICVNKPEAQLKLEHRIEARYLGEGYSASQGEVPLAKTHSASIKNFLSKGTSGPDSNVHLHLYFVHLHPFLKGKTSEEDTDIWNVSSGTFLRDKSVVNRERYHSILKRAVQTLSPVVEVTPSPRNDGETAIMIAYRKGSTHSYFSSITEIFNYHNVVCTRKYYETFANGINVYSIYVKDQSVEACRKYMEQATLSYVLPRTTLSPLFTSRKLTAEETIYAYAGWKFAYHFLNRQTEEYSALFNALKHDRSNRNRLIQLKKKIRNDAATEARCAEAIFAYSDLIKEFYAEFARFNDPKSANKAVPSRTINKELAAKIKKTVSSDLDQQILTSFLTFNAHVLRTNFYKSSKVALAFRLDPAFLADSDHPAVPFGVFLILGSDFRGFHVRFVDVARGGIRMIRSRNAATFLQNVETVFDENYNLAFTQQKKNKDIPEGGSKGAILLSLDHQNNAEVAFHKYIDAMLDLLMPNDEIVDHIHKPEYIFCGPDEGTAEYMDWAALHARKRGYRFWSSFTTGKSTHLGGIPHDLYGMTTRGVHQYVLGILNKLGINESSVTKLQTGGPDGDLGSNEIKISHDRTIAIVDGSGVLYDPEGINRDELNRLAAARKMVIHFDRTKLSPKGFLVLVEDRDVTLPDGTLVESGLNFRNAFHLNSLSTAELFVPCGGRPEAVNINNVQYLFNNFNNEEGKGPRTPRFKYIVEGANLFFTQEARIVLEDAGVILFKDASANKGGVTSSSLEVLAALALNDAEFAEHMQVKDNGKTVPQFYAKYVEEVQNKIEHNARLEFEAIWAEKSKNPSVRNCELTDQLSDKINNLNTFIQESSLWNNEKIRRKVLEEALPQTLLGLLGYETIVKRVPENYIKAIFGAHLASNYVYKFGLSGNEFSFFEFMQQYA